MPSLAAPRACRGRRALCALLPGHARAQAALSVPDPSFEQAQVGAGNFQYGPAGSPWAFANGAGVSANGSGFTSANPPAPDGGQVAFVQGNGAVSQPVAGFQAGVTYTLTVAAARRLNYVADSVRVSLDGTILGTITQSSDGYIDTAYRDYGFGPFTASAGAHTLTFTGLNPSNADCTMFLDNVRITGVSPQAPGNIAVTGHDDDLHGAVVSENIPQSHARALVGFARQNAPNPALKVLIFDHSSSDNGPELGRLMLALGVPYDVVDPDAGVPDPSLFDAGKYSAIGVASNVDAGGTDNTATSSANLLADKQYFQAFNAAGGGLFAFAGVDDPNYYAFLPRAVSSTFLNQVVGGFTQTALGASLGVPAINDDQTHNRFAPPGTSGEDPGWQSAEDYGSAGPETMLYYGAGAPPAPTLTGLTLNPAVATGGQSVTGTVTLSGPAPAGGLSVALSSDSAAATVPAAVLVPAGASGAAFTVATSAVSAATTANVTAAYGGASQSAPLTLNPGLIPAAPADLSAYATGSGRIALYWVQVPGAAGYNVYRGTAAGGEDYARPVNGTTPVGAPSYPGSGLDLFTDTGLADGTEYFYTVEAVVGGASSPASNEDSDVPNPAAIPWDTRDPGAVLSAFRGAFSGDEPYLPGLRVVGPDGTIYDAADGVAELPDGVLDPATNQVTLPDGSTAILPNDGYDTQPGGGAAPAPGLVLPNAFQGLLLPPGNGPYRRVQTTAAGWRGVQGIITLPNSVIFGPTTPTQDPIRTDSPHIYLGLHDDQDKPNQDVDAGLQYRNGGWQVFMRINGPYVEPGSNLPPGVIPALINVPTGGVKFDGGAIVSLRYYAYRPYSLTVPLVPLPTLKVSLIVADGTLYGSEEDFRALGAATKLSLADLPHIRMKRVQSLAQLRNGAGVSRTGSSFTIPSWDMGMLLAPDGTWRSWTAAQTGTILNGPNRGRVDDGSYDGTAPAKNGSLATGASADVSWTPSIVTPYATEQSTSISIYSH